jgi:hypothetical protein
MPYQIQNASFTSIYTLKKGISFLACPMAVLISKDRMPYLLFGKAAFLVQLSSNRR